MLPTDKIIIEINILSYFSLQETQILHTYWFIGKVSITLIDIK